MICEICTDNCNTSQDDWLSVWNCRPLCAIFNSRKFFGDCLGFGENNEFFSEFRWAKYLRKLLVENWSENWLVVVDLTVFAAVMWLLELSTSWKTEVFAE